MDWEDWRFVQAKRGGRIENSKGDVVALVAERFSGLVEDMLSASQGPDVGDFDYAE